MSHKTYVTVCAAIVVVGALLTVAQLLVDGPSWGDFIALVAVPVGVIGVTLARRNA